MEIAFPHQIGSLNIDLARCIRDDFRGSSVVGDHSRDAEMLAPIQLFGIAKFWAITPPYQDRENLVRIRPVKIDECRISTAPRCVVGADYLSTDGRSLPN